MILHGLAVVMFLVTTVGFAGTREPVTLAGWGLDQKNPEKFIAQAAEVGFDVLITWSNSPAVLQRAAEAGKRNNIKIFACITPGSIVKEWKNRYPNDSFPWQVMTDGENAACNFISAGKNKYLIPYQFGGEPVLANEVLLNRIVCFNHPKIAELFKLKIDELAAVSGLEGIAFDGFGYQNYHCCHCETCRKLLAEYRAKHPEMTEKAAETAFSRDVLVNFINSLADYVRSKNAKLKTTIHIWPVFAPEPLYGNRLDLDFCGQTAAWYTLWPQDKIAQYSRSIVGDAKKYYPRQQGVGMIGYYNRLPFPRKNASQVDMELSTMIDSGCRRIQVCGTKDVINTPAVAAVFKKYFNSSRKTEDELK